MSFAFWSSDIACLLLAKSLLIPTFTFPCSWPRRCLLFCLPCSHPLTFFSSPPVRSEPLWSDSAAPLLCFPLPHLVPLISEPGCRPQASFNLLVIIRLCKMVLAPSDTGPVVCPAILWFSSFRASEKCPHLFQQGAPKPFGEIQTHAKLSWVGL